MKTTDMLLSMEDFKGLKMNSEQSRLDILAQVCSVARDKFYRLKQTQPQPQLQPAKALKLKKIKIEPNNSLSPHAAHDDQETYYPNYGLNLRRRSSSSKTSRYDDEEDDDNDDDWELINVDQPKNKKKKMKKKNKAKTNCIAKKGRKQPNHHHDHDIDGPDSVVVPELPEIFRRRIDEMQGTEIRLVIKKELTKTDLSSNHNRLSMPFSMITGWGFLRDEEEANLEAQQKIIVPLIEPEPVMNVTEVTLKQWIMRKASGDSSSMYVLRTAWQEIVERNGLVQGQVVQVWSFRVQDRLHMALVAVQHVLEMLPSTTHGGAAGSSGTSGGGNSSEVADNEAPPALPEVAAA